MDKSSWEIKSSWSGSLKETSKRVWRLIKPYVPRILAASIFSIFVSGINGAIAWLVKPAMDKIFVGRHYQYIYLLPIGILILYITRGAASFLQSYLMRTAGMKMARDLRDKFFEQLMHLPMSIFSHSNSGDMLSRMTNDIGALQMILSQSLRTLMLQIPSVLVLLGVALYRKWDLALLSFVLLPFIAISTKILGSLVRKRRKRAQRCYAVITHRVTEALQGLKVIKIFCMEEKKYAQFKKENQTTYRQLAKVVRLKETTRFAIECLSGIAVALILGYGGMLVAHGKMTSGDFFSVLTAIVMAFTPLKKLGIAYSKLQEGIGVLERVDNFLEMEREKQEGKSIKGLKKGIEYKGVTFTYPSTNAPALENINLFIPAKKILAIVGPSGAGKSSLVDLLPRFYSPQKGTIYWDDVDISKINLRSLRNQMALVTQDVILFSDTVYENIVAGRKGFTKEDVIKAAKMAQAHDFIMALPNGYETVLDERGLNLSGGERQRIALARAILGNPPLLILDEATSALDARSEKAVQDAMEAVMKNRTTIVIAHRLSTILNAQKIVVMDKGQIVAQGSHEELLEKNPLYKELYQNWDESNKGK